MQSQSLNHQMGFRSVRLPNGCMEMPPVIPSYGRSLADVLPCERPQLSAPRPWQGREPVPQSWHPWFRVLNLRLNVCVG